MKPDWFTAARAKWAKEMTEARKLRLNPCVDSDTHQRAVIAMFKLRAQAKALVLIERASRQQEKQR